MVAPYVKIRMKGLPNIKSVLVHNSTFHETPSQKGKNNECDDGSHKTQEGDVSQIVEELLPPHVESRGEYDWRKADEEEESTAELEQSSKCLVVSPSERRHRY